MILNKIKKARQIPLHIALKKSTKAIKSKIYRDFDRKVASEIIMRSTPKWFSYLDRGYFQLKELEFLIDYRQRIDKIANYLLQHKFNLLGSNWIDRNFQSSKPEIRSKIPQFWIYKFDNITSYLSASNYQHINFWNDPTSNFQWDPVFHKTLKPVEGAEIKQAWELGRMQHLPILAYSFALKKFDGDNEKVQQLINEFENQILDFIATNPPFYSVQWSSPMDVGIRLANWLITHDLFISAGAKFSNFFSSEFFESIYKHILFLLKNLEWSEGLRANHYFANITALAVASVYIPFSELQMQLYFFALQEIINETLYQFNTDGGNFEGSTMYHFQVAEMLLLALYFLLNIPENIKLNIADFRSKNWLGIRSIKPLKNQLFKFNSIKKQIELPDQFIQRVQSIVQFSLNIRKSNNEIDQIGDNDSGRFLRLDYFLESKKEHLDNLLKFHLFWALQKNLMGMQSNSFYESLLSKRNKFLPAYIYSRKLQKVHIKYFDKFGLVVFKSPNYFLTFRCGSIGQKGKGGHSHNDQLSITLNYKDEDFIIDAGTYCYTKSKTDRNLFRSIQMHNTIIFENEEQNIWDENSYDDLFWIAKHRTKSKIFFLSENLFAGEHYAYGTTTQRKMEFFSNHITVLDSLPKKGNKKIHLHFHPAVIAKIESNRVILEKANYTLEIEFPTDAIILENAYYSPQYGVKIITNRIVVSFTEKSLNWHIRFPESSLSV